MTLDRARLVALAAVVIGIGVFAPTVGLDTQPTTVAEQGTLAARGDAGAQFGVGYSYWVGQRGLHEDAEAGRWFRLAADRGLAGAQYNLGYKYVTGQGVPQDDVQGHMWFNLAASRSTGELRERAVTGRDLAANQLTPDALNDAQRLAREWDAAHPQ